MINTNKNVRFPKSIEDMTVVVRDAIEFSRKLEDERHKEGWHGDPAHNIAIFIAKFMGLYGYGRE